MGSDCISSWSLLIFLLFIDVRFSVIENFSLAFIIYGSYTKNVDRLRKDRPGDGCVYSSWRRDMLPAHWSPPHVSCAKCTQIILICNLCSVRILGLSAFEIEADKIFWYIRIYKCKCKYFLWSNSFLSFRHKLNPEFLISFIEQFLHLT